MNSQTPLGKLARILNLTQHMLVRKTAWILFGRIAGLFLQAAYFVLLARLLPVAEYGLFAGIFAVVNTITPYSALGAAMLFMRYLAIEPRDARRYWGNSLATTSAFTSLSILAAIGYGLIMHSSVHMGIAIALLLSNCFFYQITVLGGMLLYSLGDARAFAWMNLLSNLFRFIVLLIMWMGLHQANAFQWALGTMAASFMAAVLVYRIITRRVGTPEFDGKLLYRRSVEGLGFSFAGTTEAVNNDLDKVMLAHYGMYVQNGFYTLAYRVLDFATSPIVALNTVITQRHFQISKSGAHSMLRLAVKSIGAAIAMGAAIAAVLWVCSPLLPRITGRDFSGAILVLRYLCLLPLIRGIHQMAGSMVTGAGHQNWRTATQASVAVLNLVLNLFWIRSYGWRGAVWSTLASDGTLAILNVLLIFAVTRTLGSREFDSEAADEEVL